jgi:parallel beta-helix repeat protein
VVTCAVDIVNSATLTIAPGVGVCFRENTQLKVGDVNEGSGTLIARGTAEAPIRFFGGAQPGHWVRIYFTPYAVDAAFDDEGDYVSGSILEHVLVKNAGRGDVAAVYAESSAPFLKDCEIRDNKRVGIMADGTAPGMRIVNCIVSCTPNVNGCLSTGIYLSRGDNRLIGNAISGNTASGHGGGIYLSGSNSTLTGNTITDNTAPQYGGGIYFSGNNNALTGNTITDNTSNYGGGIMFYGSNCTLTGNTITGNTTSQQGGGIYLSGSTNTLTGNTISGNTASVAGGGMYLHGSSSNTLTGNTVTGNTASVAGGGMYLQSGSSNTLTGNTVTGNTASGHGSGIAVVSSNNITLSGNTITENEGPASPAHACAIYVGGNSQRVSLLGDPGTSTYNIICHNDGCQIHNDNLYSSGGEYDVDARHVQWCTEDGGTIMSLICDYFDDPLKAKVRWIPPADTGDQQACCFADGSCAILTPIECQVDHGAPQGQGTTCGTSDCSPPPPPEIVATPDGPFCEGAEVTLDAGAGYANYLWLPGGQTTRTIMVTAGGTYRVIVTDDNGFEWSDDEEITVARRVLGDVDGDCDFDLVDWAELVNAFTGPLW